MRKIAVILAMMTAAALLAGASRPYLDITGPNFRPLPLAIVEIVPPPAAGEELKSAVREFNSTLKNDLELSGLFKILDPKSFLAKPETDGFEESSIKWQSWADVGAEALIKGKATLGKTEGTVNLGMKVFGVVTAELYFGKDLPVSVSNPRLPAHRFANEVVKFFTGENGIFTTRIACVKKVRGGETINVIDMDGHNEKTLVDNGSLNLFPSWSPDGRSLFYTSFQNHNPDLYELPPGGSLPKVISKSPGLNTGAQVSPDGSKILLTLSRDNNSEIYVISRKGEIISRLTDDLEIDCQGSWSPDGKKIAFISARSGNPHIYLMNADGSGQKRLTFRGNYNQTPRWSPKGDKIAFTARDERNVFDIFVVDPLNGENITRLTQDMGNNLEPTWAPNGKQLAFISTRSGVAQIYIMNADGTNQRMITDGKGNYDTPAWSPRTGD